MKTFFVLILISFKLLAFPIGNSKAMFESDTKSKHFKKHQNSVNITTFDKKLPKIKESEHNSSHTIPKKSGSNFEDSLVSPLTQSKSPSWAYSP